MVDNERDHLFKLLHSFDTAMLVTQDERSDAFRSRPMYVAQMEDNGDFWFISGEETNKVIEMQQHDGILLTFQKDGECYISLCGKAELVTDRQKLDQLWKEEFRIWFPQGQADPHIVLIHVRPIDAEYWDNTGMNKLRYAREAATALAEGEPPQIEQPEQFGHVNFQGSNRL